MTPLEEQLARAKRLGFDEVEFKRDRAFDVICVRLSGTSETDIFGCGLVQEDAIADALGASIGGNRSGPARVVARRDPATPGLEG